MITLSRLKRAGMTSIATILLPATVFAATPQQMLNAAVKSNLAAPYRVNGDVKLDFTEKPLARGERTKTAHLEMRFDQRVQNDMKGSEASEGKLTVANFKASGSYDGDPDIELPSSITFEWKSVNGVAYLKIQELPSLVTEQFSALGLDLSKIAGRWISFDVGEFRDEVFSQLPLGADLPENPVASDKKLSLNEFLGLTKISPLQVLRTESKKTLADGRTVMRLRIRVNPAFVNEMQRLDRLKIGLKDVERAEKLKALTTRYTELRKALRNLHAVVELDVATSKITRVELGGKQTEPSKSCDWNDDYTKQICKIVGYKTVQYAVGINILADDGHAVIAPADAVDFKTLLEELSPPEPEPEPVPEPIELQPEMELDMSM